MKLQPDVEEKTEQTTDSGGESPKRKVPRRDTSSGADVAMGAKPTKSPTATVADPTIDEYTHLLGIGWTHIGQDSESVAMAREYSRYIEKHYPLSDSEVLAKSKNLEAYLVKATQGYFLFSEVLTEGRLVARTWEDALANLQSSPVRFSWAQPFFASRTPDTVRETDSDTTKSFAMAVEGGDMEID